MSMRLLVAWREEMQVLHTPIDDLESFVWVLVWIALVRSKHQKVARDYMDRLSSDQISLVAATKAEISLNVQQPYDVLYDILRHILPLLVDWFAIAAEARSALDRLIFAASKKHANLDELLASEAKKSKLKVTKLLPGYRSYEPQVSSILHGETLWIFAAANAP